jgi:hypothetical protein
VAHNDGSCSGATRTSSDGHHLVPIGTQRSNVNEWEQCGVDSAIGRPSHPHGECLVHSALRLRTEVHLSRRQVVRNASLLAKTRMDRLIASTVAEGCWCTDQQLVVKSSGLRCGVVKLRLLETYFTRSGRAEGDLLTETVPSRLAETPPVAPPAEQ